MPHERREARITTAKVATTALLVLAGFGYCTELWACSAHDKNCSFPASAYLNAHNQHRARHCVPALKWDAALAAKAQAWANRCVWAHEPRATKGAIGENLYFRSPTLSAVGTGVDAWYREIGLYDFNSTKYVPGAGHFTQLIWKATTHVGCAVKACPNMQGGGVIMVCRYAPQGNMTFNGKWQGPQNVPRVCR